MIYLFCGNDTKNKTINYEKFLKSVSKDTEIISINKNDFNKMGVESLYSSSGLFFIKSLVIFNNIFEREELLDFILEKLDLIAEAKNDFAFLEGKLNKPIIDAFKKVRAEINVFELAKEKLEKYNNFLLADDFGNRDKLNLWIHFREAIDLGVGMEELVGVLFWKAKDMLLKKNFNKFSEQELQNFATKLSYILPEARREGLEAETILEQFLLESF